MHFEAGHHFQGSNHRRVIPGLSAVRGAINSLIAELIQDHIRNHMPRNSKSSEEAADDVIQIVRSYLK